MGQLRGWMAGWSAVVALLTAAAVGVVTLDAGVAPTSSDHVVAGDEPGTTPPRLAVTRPADGARVGERVLRFTGETEPGAAVASGPYAATVGPDGRWSIVLVLSPGPNVARFTATDAAGNASTASVRVVYDPPPSRAPGTDVEADEAPGETSGDDHACAAEGDGCREACPAGGDGSCPDEWDWEWAPGGRAAPGG